MKRFKQISDMLGISSLNSTEWKVYLFLLGVKIMVLGYGVGQVVLNSK